MLNRIGEKYGLVFGLGLLVGGSLGYEKADARAESIGTQVCASLSMARKEEGASVDMAGKGTLLEIPGELTVQGEMTGGLVFLEFNRPKHGVLRCRYKQGENNVPTLEGCEPIAARAGDSVDADRFSVSIDESTGAVGGDVMVTACALTVARGPKPVPDIDVPPGFRRLPNGEVVRPEEEGVSLQPEPIAFGMTGELEKQYRRVVTQDATSRSVLGRRLAYIYAETIEPPKGKKRDSINVKLWYFSYAANTAVAVTLKNGVVQKAEKTEYWPPEGREEVEAAVALARSHPALRGKVNDLEGGATLAQAERGRAPSWLGNRALDVRFFDADRVSKYMALVDLTTEKVLRAGHVGSFTGSKTRIRQ